ncbi:MAG TPA: hypothetical protein VGY55_11020 [Pirellulales bacterium]|jgi:hypothetical protein|nr:hypothetical protein [Pirellulales bacterium]
MSSAGAAAAAAGAAAAAERMRQEEEEMTKYADADLKDDWEFKIVRSNTASFKNPETLRRVCEEEAQAGWILLEKFDNQRLRFKRPASARAGDAALIGYDPYRSNYGISALAIVMIVLFCTLLGVAAIIGIVALFVKH